jgi:hypothetical protein
MARLFGKKHRGGNDIFILIPMEEIMGKFLVKEKLPSLNASYGRNYLPHKANIINAVWLYKVR